jgi:hypothetical protein
MSSAAAVGRVDRVRPVCRAPRCIFMIMGFGRFFSCLVTRCRGGSRLLGCPAKISIRSDSVTMGPSSDTVERDMNLTVEIPDDLAARLSADGQDLSRRALEALAADEYRNGRLNKTDLRRLFGFETSYEIDGFLKAHGVFDEYTLEDFERERQALKSLGF